MEFPSDEHILQLIKSAIRNKTELHKVEFKDARGGLPTSNLWKTISSFSHQPGGGIIVFGIQEDRPKKAVKVVGVPDAALLQEQVFNYLTTEMVNPGPSELLLFDYPNEGSPEGQILVLAIQATPDEHKPCYHRKQGLPGGACLRFGNVDRIITPDEMRSFIRNSSVFKFDRSRALNASTADLDLERLRNFLTKSAGRVGRSAADNEPTYEVLRNLGIADTFSGEHAPTVGGYLLFSRATPQNNGAFSRFVVRCVRYQGLDPASPIVDKQDVVGTLDEQIDLIHKFILRNIAVRAEIKGTKRIETYEYPEEALRELVANAVIHRDYQISETYTQVSIYSNRIEISNPGSLPPGVTIHNIKEAQFSRNEVIAAILRDMNYLEEYGRGIDIVYSRMAEMQLMHPIFKNSSNSFKVVLVGESSKDLNQRQIKIVEYLQEKLQITAKIAETLFPEVSRPTINNDLRRLVTLGLASQEGTSTNTYYRAMF